MLPVGQWAVCRGQLRKDRIPSSLCTLPTAHWTLTEGHSLAHLKELLARNQLVRIFGLGQLCHPKLVEMVGLQGGYEAVWLDQEHCGLSVQQIEEATRAARAVGLDSFVRLTATDYATVMRPLEAGAGGIMAAQVRSARETEQIVTWAKFHPRGLRGVNSSGVDGGFGPLPFPEYARRANAETF